MNKKNKAIQYKAKDLFENVASHVKFYFALQSPCRMVKENLEMNLERITKEFEDVQNMTSLHQYHFDSIMSELNYFASYSDSFEILYNKLNLFFTTQNQSHMLSEFVADEFFKIKKYVLKLIDSLENDTKIKINCQEALNNVKSPSITFRMSCETYLLYLNYCEIATMNFLKYCLDISSVSQQNLTFLMNEMKQVSDKSNDSNFHLFNEQSQQRLTNMMNSCLLKKNDLENKINCCDSYKQMYDYGSKEEMKKIFDKSKKLFQMVLKQIEINIENLTNKSNKRDYNSHEVECILEDCNVLRLELDALENKSKCYSKKMKRVMKKIKKEYKETLKSKKQMQSISSNCNNFKKEHFKTIFLMIYESFDEINCCFVKMKNFVETCDSFEKTIRKQIIKETFHKSIVLKQPEGNLIIYNYQN